LNKDQQQFYKDWLAAMEHENEFYTDIPFRPRTDKATRITDEIDSLWSLNKIYFNKNMPSDTLKKALTQIFKFPNEKHDDIADCIAQ
jgi:phage terminase large subunit-like protein